MTENLALEKTPEALDFKEDDGEVFEEKDAKINCNLKRSNAKAASLDEAIKTNLKENWL